MKRLLIVLFITVVVLIIFFWSGRLGQELLEVEIKAPPGTKVFVTLPGGEEQYLKNVSTLDNGPIMVEVPPDATDIILRHNREEKVFPYNEWRGGTISHDFSPKFDRVSIDADPDAEVFIIRPGTDEEDFIDNVPLTMNVPINATVILKYRGEKKVFLYKQGRERIYHNFSP